LEGGGRVNTLTFEKGGVHDPPPLATMLAPPLAGEYTWTKVLFTSLPFVIKGTILSLT